MLRLLGKALGVVFGMILNIALFAVVIAIAVAVWSFIAASVGAYTTLSVVLAALYTGWKAWEVVNA